MDNTSYDPSDKESSERRNSNSEWLPTKCRITKPPPPKPATNPLQFVKVSPSNLYQKAREQVKKVEEIKTQKLCVKEDAEEWQQNLDNWKSSRRKIQEHIIERVVEVKKFEQEGCDRNRRRSKTFNEIMEDRNKRGHRLTIPIYDDDSNDLSDYGIGSSSSKTNSVKDVDTDDSSSCLDEKDAICISNSDSQSGKDASSASNQSQSEDELLSSTNRLINKDNNSKPNIYNKADSYTSTVYTNLSNKQTTAKPALELYDKHEECKDEDYTYQRAIEDYRSKILPRLIECETIYAVKFDNSASKPVPKVEMYSSKSAFTTKNVEVTPLDLNSSKRLSEDFANSLSIKERLKSLEKCADLQIKNMEKNTQGTPVTSVKSIIKSFTKQVDDNDNKNNNFDSSKVSDKLPNKLSKTENVNESQSLYLVDNISHDNKKDCEVYNRSESPELDAYINKLNEFNQDLDSYLPKTHSPQSSLSECCEHITAPPSVSSTELIGLSSDREDSGIHTADVSCSVSQADESVEYNDILSSTIPNCIEKLQKERERELSQQIECKLSSQLRETQDSVVRDLEGVYITEGQIRGYKSLIEATQTFLENIKQHANNDGELEKTSFQAPTNNSKEHQPPFFSKHNSHQENKTKPAIYENVEIENYSGFVNDDFVTSTFPLAPPKTKEPPKEKPPPPPEDDEKPEQTNIKRLNSTKRIKKEMYMKRSSFLGLYEPTDDIIDPVIPIETPPDVNTFLQKESQMEKSLYRKYQDSRETCSSEVESQDSGLEIERGRLSSDTWCSSLGETNISTHGRQDSEQTNISLTSEEDEIAKKEREIIALVEKEEKSKDSNQYPNINETSLACCSMVRNNVKNEKFKIPYFPKNNTNCNILSDDQDSEVLRVEQELMQLEQEELERRKENMRFRENREKLLYKNRYSLENICDVPNTFSGYYKDISCRKSMPDLPNDRPIGSYFKYQNAGVHHNYYNPGSGIDTYYRKSMPDIQQAYLKSVDISDIHNELQLPLEHRKSLPELQKTITISTSSSYPSFHNQPVRPGKSVPSLIKEQRDKNKLLTSPPVFESDSVWYQNIQSGAPISRPGFNALSAVPKQRHIPNDNWIQPKVNGNSKPKSYSKHWLYQEAELRRLSEQKTGTSKWNYQQTQSGKHIPEPIIQTLTQRVQNMAMNDRNRHKRSENNLNPEIVQHPSYMNRPHTVGHASPIAYPPPTAIQSSEGKILSVSGKKKCSFCGNELGRGAAMIIESLCLFYHMDCFKCCVCHVQLGDGLMGTDVRVRNQKLHCHNCYTSDDGIKFSCV